MPNLLLASVALLCLATAVHAQAGLAGELTHRDLTREEVLVVGLREGRLSYFDRDRALREADAGEFVELRMVPEPVEVDTRGGIFGGGGGGLFRQSDEVDEDEEEVEKPEEGGEGVQVPNFDEVPPIGLNPAIGLKVDPGDVPVEAWLVLTDGQTLPGRWSPTRMDRGDEDTIAWRHTRLGTMTIPLDRVAGLAVGEDGRDRLAGQAGLTSDVVVLTNGDRVGGFVEAIEDQSVRLLTEGVDEAVDLPRERVRAVLLANPPSAPPTQGYFVSLDDGTRVVASGLTLSRDSAEIALPEGLRGVADRGGVSKINAERVESVAFLGSGLRLISLVSLPREVTAGGEVWGLPAMPVAEGGGDLWMHAPVTVVFRLPAGAVRFAAEVELAREGGVSLEAWSLADVGVVIDGGEAAATLSLDSANPGEAVSMPLTGDSVSVELRSGERGPVLDRVRLVNPRVLVRTVGK